MTTAVVLGASTGVGGEIAKRLAKTGRDVIGFHRGRHNADARDVCRYITEEANQCVTMRTMDVGSSLAAVEEGLEVVLDLAINPIDVVVHSLSGASVGRALDLTSDQIERTFWNLAHSFLWWVRGLVNTDRLAPGCRFLALTNPCTGYYLRNSGVIGAAKSALDSYVRTLACELGPKGYRVNGLSFGAVATASLVKVIASGKLAGVTPANGVIQTPDDIAALAVDIVTSPGTGGINGAVVDGTGGATVKLMDHAFHGTTTG